MFYTCILFMRLMMTGFMGGHQASSAFVAVGPPGFTGLALINLGANARVILPLHNLVSATAGEVWYAASVMVALMLFGLAIFLVLFAALPYWSKVNKSLDDVLSYWALTFPNVGWISTLGTLGNVLGIPFFSEIQVFFVILMVVIWCILIVFTITAFRRGRILNAKPEEVLADEKHRFSEKGAV